MILIEVILLEKLILSSSLEHHSYHESLTVNKFRANEEVITTTEAIFGMYCENRKITSSTILNKNILDTAFSAKLLNSKGFTKRYV